MLDLIAIENYRSIRRLVLRLQPLTVVTGPNGSGKSNLYRALRLITELLTKGALESLADEGGFRHALFAGTRDRGERVSMRLGVSIDDWSYAVDLGLPVGSAPMQPFPLDPEFKTEVIWAGDRLRPSAVVTQRRGRLLATVGAKESLTDHPVFLSPAESMLAVAADPVAFPELFALREQARSWRFYDSLRTDRDAPARRASPATYSPQLPGDGSRLPATWLTIQRLGGSEVLAEAVDRAFHGCRVHITEDDRGDAHLEFEQPGLARALAASELSDGTLRYLLLTAALSSRRPAPLIVLNEPEASLHPSLFGALGALILAARESSQVVVVTHSAQLVEHLADAQPVVDGELSVVDLTRESGSTSVRGRELLEQPPWTWPRR